MPLKNRTILQFCSIKFSSQLSIGLKKPVLTLTSLVLILLLPTITKAQTASFTVNPVGGTFCAPTQVRFNATFSATPVGISWRFGVGSNESSVANPTFTYTAPGTYNVVLTVLFDSALVTVEETVTILGRPTLSINRNRNFICTPGEINFTAQSNQPLTNIAWDFGDGSATVNDDTLAISHFYNNFQNYTIRAVATNLQGCNSNAATTTVSLRRLTPDLTVTPSSSGCIPATVRLRARFAVPAGSTTTSFIWNFGDGSTERNTNSANVTSYTYNTTNGVVPTVAVTTSEGCTETFVFDTLFFGTPPTNLVLASLKDSFCFSETATFKATADLANEYRWDFGDGTTLITKNSEVTRKYTSLGNYNVSVRPFFNGCGGTTARKPISIVGPQANFSFANTCNDRSTFTFNNTSIGVVDTVSWRFGVGGGTSDLMNPNFTFPPSGTHNTRLIAIENATGCADTIAKPVYTAEPALFTNPTFACLNSSVRVSLVGTSTTNNPAVRYNYIIAGRNRNNQTTASNALIADTLGFFTNQVIIVNGPGYCNDTLIQTDPIRIAGPVVDFDMPALLCISDSLRPINNSFAGFASDTIINWLWNFGDSTLIDSVQHPLPILYAKTGNFDVSLTATDINGCSTTLAKEVNVRSLPLLLATSGSSIICPNDTISLLALHQGTISWSPSVTLDCDTCSSVLAFPSVPTNYIATAIDSFGCMSMDTAFINVQAPFVFNPALNDTLLCLGESVQLDVGINDLIYQWTPAVGLSAANIRNPIATPQSNTLYNISVSDTLGCASNTAQVFIEIAPLPTIDSLADLIIPYNTPFTITPRYSADIVNYNWQPGIPILNCTNCANPGGQALESTVFTITVTNSGGCIGSDTVNLFVACDENNLFMPTGFTPNRDNLNDIFYPITRGVKEIRRFQVYNRFGQIVYERYNIRPNDTSFGWDGTFKGVPQASGNYMYIMEAVCDLDGIISKKGNVMLVR